MSEKENLLYRIELAEDTINHIEYQTDSVIPYRMMIGRIKLIINNYNQTKKHGHNKETKTK